MTDTNDFTVVPRRPGPRPMTCDKRKVNAVVCNGRMTEVLDAMCFLEGRRPHQLVHDVMLAYLQAQEKLPEVKKAIRMQRLSAAGIHPLPEAK